MFVFYIATPTHLLGMICPIDRSNWSCYSAAIEINPLHDVELVLWGLALFESNLKTLLQNQNYYIVWWWSISTYACTTKMNQTYLTFETPAPPFTNMV